MGLWNWNEGNEEKKYSIWGDQWNEEASHGMGFGEHGKRAFISGEQRSKFEWKNDNIGEQGT